VNLWGTQDIAKFFGVKLRTVTDKWTKRPDFPPPAQRISRKTVRWKAEDVQAWATAERR
jgi:predicted DNA-binding transcriptional regulator AlpA